MCRVYIFQAADVVIESESEEEDEEQEDELNTSGEGVAEIRQLKAKKSQLEKQVKQQVSLLSVTFLSESSLMP